MLKFCTALVKLPVYVLVYSPLSSFARTRIQTIRNAWTYKDLQSGAHWALMVVSEIIKTLSNRAVGTLDALHKPHMYSGNKENVNCVTNGRAACSTKRDCPVFWAER